MSKSEHKILSCLIGPASGRSMFRDRTPRCVIHRDDRHMLQAARKLEEAGLVNVGLIPEGFTGVGNTVVTLLDVNPKELYR